ncbi:MAG: S-adenosylmethionine tRNA ribosyltransferase [Bacteroidetes bacterium GWA2_30_7]|nr:MAG: S-adenosylmethionine tRNA ribosyltransferase [Bacteroidetes bacterium GWA2_30_7]
MIIPKISTIQYNYNLPDEKIAKFPLDIRDNSKLLIYSDKNIIEDKFLNIDKYLPSDSNLILNNTKVIQARIIFQRATGAKIEVFCLEPFLPAEYYSSFSSTESCTWKCMIGNLKKWKEPTLIKELKIKNEIIRLSATKIDISNNNVSIKFSWNNPKYCFSQILENCGIIPIPPYLSRNSTEKDKETYQTIYSKHNGSVAAPTAGLHFTENVFEKLKSKNISINELTLHVGAGTFKPMTSDKVENHEMHSEYFSFSLGFLKSLYNNHENLIVSGTTSTRCIETIYWMALKLYNKLPDFNFIDQWDAYNLTSDLSPKEAFEILFNYMKNNSLNQISGYTKIMIVPGYKFKFVKYLITNFHQPNSTLLLLVSAFIGEDWKKVYDYALYNDFRFLSYGDSSLLRLNNE